MLPDDNGRVTEVEDVVAYLSPDNPEVPLVPDIPELPELPDDPFVPEVPAVAFNINLSSVIPPTNQYSTISLELTFSPTVKPSYRYEESR